MTYNKDFFDDYNLHITNFIKNNPKVTDMDVINSLMGKYTNMINENVNNEIVNKLGKLDKQKNILMIGTSGSGKSTLSNILYNYKTDYENIHAPFPISNKLSGKTKDLTTLTSLKTFLKIVDSPGLNDNRDEGIVISAIYLLSILFLDGVDYIIITLGEKRITTDVVDVLKIIKNLTKDMNINNNIIFVITHCDDSEPKTFDNDNKDKSKIKEYINDLKKYDDYKVENFEILDYFYKKNKNNY